MPAVNTKTYIALAAGIRFVTTANRQMKGNKGLESICSEEGCSEHTTGRYENYSCLGRLEREREREREEERRGGNDHSHHRNLLLFDFAGLVSLFSSPFPFQRDVLLPGVYLPSYLDFNHKIQQTSSFATRVVGNQFGQNLPSIFLTI